MENIVKVGMVGMGGISQLHLAGLAGLGGVKVSALCDVEIDRARNRAVEFELDGAACYEDFERMLAEADFQVLHIMTPHYLHADMAIRALEAGKYVLLEKPMDISLHKIRALIRADAHGRLGIVYQNRYNPASVAAKRAIECGEYGKLLALRANVAWRRGMAYYDSGAWRGKWATEGGGVLINQSIHTMDLMYFLGGAFGRIKGSATCDVLAGKIEVEDNAHAVIEYADGKPGLFYASNNYAVDDAVELHMTLERGALRLIGNNLYRMDGDIHCLLKADDEKTVGKAVYGNGHSTLIADFYDCVRTGRTFPIGGREGYPSIWAALSIYESGKRDTWIDFA